MAISARAKKVIIMVQLLLISAFGAVLFIGGFLYKEKPGQEENLDEVRTQRFGEPGAFLQSAERLEIFSLYPYKPMGEDAPETQGEFREYGIMGKMEVGGRKEIEGVWRELHGNVYAGKGEIYTVCFSPRHGIRAYKGERVVDYLICFECGHMHIHEEGKEMYYVSINGGKGPVLLNKMLDGAGVPRNKPEY